jgi:hypothetical protein
MYAQCDPGGNQYVLLDCLVDFDKLSAAISLADQNIVVKGCFSKRCNMYGWKICLPMEGRLHNMGVSQESEEV